MKQRGVLEDKAAWKTTEGKKIGALRDTVDRPCRTLSSNQKIFNEFRDYCSKRS